MAQLEEARPETERATLGPMEEAAPPTDGSDEGVDLDPEQLSPDALRGLVEEYVTREGTEYGPSDWSLEDKVAQVLRQIDLGEARIVFDLEAQSASIVTAPELALHALHEAEAGSRDPEDP